METDKILICRLCFEICKSGFEVIEESTKETLNFLLLNLDLEMSDEPLICDSCVAGLKECLDFKTDRLRKSGSIVIKHEGVHLNVPKIHLNESVEDTPDLVCDSCVGGLKECLHAKTDCLQKSGSIIVKHEGVGLNVPKIHPTESGIDTPEAFNNSKVCCSCKELINGESCAHWTNEENNMTKMLEKYFPELSLNGTTASTCVACYKSLQNQLDFISKCLAVENKIREYCKAEGTNSKGQVELSNVLHFLSKNQLQNNICGSINSFKAGNICEETESEDNFKVENKNFVVIEEPGIYSIEKEDVDIKTEQDDDNRFNAQVAQENYMEQYVPSQSNIAEAPQFDCKVCGKLFKQRSSLTRHTKLHKHPSEVTMHKCKICTYQSTQRSKIAEHMLVHQDPSEVTMYKCEMCSYQNKRKHKVSAHMLNHHRDPLELTMYKCELCPYQCRLEYRILEHMVTHKDSSEVVMYKCDICDYQCKRKYNLSKHILNRHEPPEEMFKCKVCTYQTKLKYSLAKHMLVHQDSSEVVMYKCELCTYQGKRKYNLDKHISRWHGGPSEVTVDCYKCELCWYQCKQKCSLTQHMLSHKDPSEWVMYKCDLCAYQTSRKGTLAKHIVRTHRPSEVPLYKCKICAFQCRHRYMLTEHKLTHQDPSEVVTYKCKLCTYKSIHKNRLSKHMLRHKDPSEIVMYKCDMCTYQTRYKCSLSKHMQTHKDPSEIVMYKCEICTHQSRSKYRLSKHMLTHSSKKKSAAANTVLQTRGKRNDI